MLCYINSILLNLLSFMSLDLVLEPCQSFLCQIVVKIIERRRTIKLLETVTDSKNDKIEKNYIYTRREHAMRRDMSHVSPCFVQMHSFMCYYMDQLQRRTERNNGVYIFLFFLDLFLSFLIMFIFIFSRLFNNYRVYSYGVNTIYLRRTNIKRTLSSTGKIHQPNTGRGW